MALPGREGRLQTSPASEGLPDKDILKSISFDLGATLKASEAFAISVVGNNLSNPDHGFQPMTIGGGLGLSLGDFGLEGDVVSDFVSWDENKLRAMVGGEGLFANHFAARLGYRYDQGAVSHAVSAGVGYIDRAFDVDIAVRRVVSGDDRDRNIFGFSYHLEARASRRQPAIVQRGQTELDVALGELGRVGQSRGLAQLFARARIAEPVFVMTLDEIVIALGGEQEAAQALGLIEARHEQHAGQAWLAFQAKSPDERLREGVCGRLSAAQRRPDEQRA